MGEDQGQVGTQLADEHKTPEQLQREIEDARRDLGETAAAFAAKADVKARAKEKAAEIKQSAAAKKEEFVSKAKQTSPETAQSAAATVKGKARAHPVPAAAAGAFLGGFLLGRLTGR